MQSFRKTFLGMMSPSISAKLHLLSEVVFQCEFFLLSSSNISKTPFFRTLAMASISLIKKDYIATTRDSSKYDILVCKIRNQIHTNLEKKKVPQQASGNFGQK